MAGRIAGRIALAGWLLALTACEGAIGGADRTDTRSLAQDVYGCPDLGGTYAFSAPVPRGVSYEGSLLERIDGEAGVQVVAAQVSGLRIRRFEPGSYELRFILAPERVRMHLDHVRRYERERYATWYQLIREPGRSAAIASEGEARYAERLRALGPLTEVVKVVRVGSGEAACDDGWLELPRSGADPIRLSLAKDGAIVGTSVELDTVQISLWCGDGCRGPQIPVGRYTAHLRWQRHHTLQPWTVDALLLETGPERPLDEIEAERRAQALAQSRADGQRYLANGDIRARLQALAPDDTRVERVDVRNGEVFVQYVAPVEEVDVLLQRVAEASGGRVSGAPQRVQRIVKTTRQFERTVEFVLTDSPLVLRYPEPGRVADEPATRSAPGVESGPPASALVALSPGPDASGPPPARPDARPDAGYDAPQPSSGQADAEALRERAQALFPAGCRVLEVRQRGERVVLSGLARDHHCVSDGLRALDTAHGRPELVSIGEDAGEGRRFRVLVAASALVRH